MINETLKRLQSWGKSLSKHVTEQFSFPFSLVPLRYTIFDSKQMPPIAQPPSHAPLLMVQPTQSTAMHNQMTSPPPVPLLPSMDVLSVSSKKLCSYCNHELGSGAAMIIENLGLFYHIDCFKCSVCQTPISDGNIHGTDVRVRNSRLHCHNCFSNEEGVKFSCVWLINLSHLWRVRFFERECGSVKTCYISHSPINYRAHHCHTSLRTCSLFWFFYTYNSIISNQRKHSTSIEVKHEFETNSFLNGKAIDDEW